MSQETVIGRVVVGADEIRENVVRVAVEIRAAYEGKAQVRVIVLLMGAKRFADDLFVAVGDDKFEVEYIKASSYENGTQSSRRVKIEGGIKGDIKGKEVLVVDDIYDTGFTLKEVSRWLGDQGAAVKLCVLLAKEKGHEQEVVIDFLGMNVPDEYLVGYGLDYEGKYRELGFLAVLGE